MNLDIVLFGLGFVFVIVGLCMLWYCPKPNEMTDHEHYTAFRVSGWILVILGGISLVFGILARTGVI